MKGYKDAKGKDRPPCATCRHRNKMTVEAPCYSCIDNVDLALHKPNAETEFANYEAEESEAAERREDIEKSPVDCSTPSVTDSKGDTE